MAGLIGYIFMWVLSSIAFNRLFAIEDGENFASEMIPLQVLGALFWPVFLPFAIVCVAVKLISKILKEI